MTDDDNLLEIFNNLVSLSGKGKTASLVSSAPDDAALLYLRVSDKSQMRTSIDPEGNSIPAQRKCGTACLARNNLTLAKDGEYVEPGVSGLSIDKRPEFQRMIRRIITQRDVKYVVVYMFSRATRNRYEDAIIEMILGRLGVTVLSAKEGNIGNATPYERAMRGWLAVQNQLASEMSGMDIQEKMGHKAKLGGTLGRAKLGYLNHREKVAGSRGIATVILDPDRADYVRQIFQLYADGYTLEQTQEIITDRGLRTLATARHGEKPVSVNKISLMLRDRYYCGYVTYKGIEYPGQHEALVSEELFDKVQEVRESRSANVSRQRKHRHHLKGRLWCERCRERFVLTQVTGNGGTYFYFFCRGRDKGTCPMPYLRVDGPTGVEAAIRAHLDRVSLPAECRDALAVDADHALNQAATAPDTSARDTLRNRLADLNRQEDAVVDLVGNPDWDTEKLGARLRKIRRQQAAVTRQLDQLDTAVDYSTGRTVLALGLDLLARPGDLYEQTSNDTARALLVGALWSKIYLNADRDGAVTVASVEDETPFDAIRDAHHEGHTSTERPIRTGDTRSACRVPHQRSRGAAPKSSAPAGDGSNKPSWVEVPGIEPGSSGESSGLLRAQSAMSLLGPFSHANKLK